MTRSKAFLKFRKTAPVNWAWLIAVSQESQALIKAVCKNAFDESQIETDEKGGGLL